VDRPSARVLWRSIPFLTLSMALPSCSDTAVQGDGGASLTRAEALALAGQVGLESLAFGQSRAGIPIGSGAPPAAAARSATVSVTYSLTRPCILGGRVDSSGRITVETDDATDLAVVDLEATDVHHACVFLAGGARVAVTGDPDVTTTIHAASVAGEARGTQSVAVSGGLRFTADDGRSGRCTLDILVEVNPDTAFQSTRGTLCGFTFDVTVEG
jgi:hypothetical protein